MTDGGQIIFYVSLVASFKQIAMKPDVMPELLEVIKSDYYRPAISIIMPFEPKMSSKSALTHSLKIIADKVEAELFCNYPEELCKLMMQKIKHIFKTLRFDTHKKSIAIFISPVFEKVIYMEMPVDERVTIDDTFEIRDILYAKKTLKQYLVLLISRNKSCIYLASFKKFEVIVINNHQSDNSVNEAKERVANFTDASSRKETLMDKSLRNIDHVLDVILKAYDLPLFVLGDDKIVGHFKSITKHANHIVEYINRNYMDASINEIEKALQPHVENWDNIKQKHFLNQLQEAAGNGNLAVGIRNVRRQANNHNGRLLLVEKDFVYPAPRGKESFGDKTPDRFNRFSHVKDEVDDIIEKVLEYGGDVEFTDNDILKNYNRIALVQFY